MPLIPPPTIRVIIDPGALASVRGGSGRRLRSFRAREAERDAEILSQTATAFLINTPERLALMVGQLGYESSGFQLRVEGVSYRNGSSRPDSRYRGRGGAQVSGSARRPGGPLVVAGNYQSYTNYLARRDRPCLDIAPPADLVRNPERLAENPYSVHSAGWYMRVGGFLGVRERRSVAQGGNRIPEYFERGPMPMDAGVIVADRYGVTLESCMWLTYNGWRPSDEYVFTTGPIRHEMAQSALRAFQNGGARFERCSGPACLDMNTPAQGRPGGSSFRFRRMSMGGGVLPGLALAAQGNVFTSPKVYLGGAGIPDAADVLSKLTGEAVDLSLAPTDKRFGYEKNGDYYAKDGAYIPAPSHIPELP